MQIGVTGIHPIPQEDPRQPGGSSTHDEGSSQDKLEREAKRGIDLHHQGHQLADPPPSFFVSKINPR